LSIKTSGKRQLEISLKTNKKIIRKLKIRKLKENQRIEIDLVVEIG
jgi:hypothetical protein